MNYRSWLVVAGSSEKKLGRAIGSGADAIIVDLDESVPLELKPEARRLAGEWLAAHRETVLERRMARWVRINAIGADRLWREDIEAIMPFAPDGIILPKAASPEAVSQLAAEIYEMEQRHRLPANSTRIIPQVGQTPQSALTIGQYLDSGHQRLFGLSWGAKDLSAAMGVTRCVDDAGHWTDTFRFVRVQTLLTAHACGLLAIDAAFSNVADTQGLAAFAKQARSDGFAGMVAIDPDQVPVINGAFAPSEGDLSHAREIIAAFEADPGARALDIQGRVIERSQLKAAERLLGHVDRPARQDARQAAPILRPA